MKKRFEHKRDKVDANDTRAYLKEISNEGWELCAVMPDWSCLGASAYFFIKKQVNEE